MNAILAGAYVLMFHQAYLNARNRLTKPWLSYTALGKSSKNHLCLTPIAPNLYWRIVRGVFILKYVGLIPNIRASRRREKLNLALLFRKSLCHRLSSHAALSKYYWGIGDIYAIPGGGGFPFIKIGWPDQSNQGGVVQSWVSARF